MNYLYLKKEDKLNYINFLIYLANARIKTGVSDTISQEQLNIDLITLPLLIQEKENIEKNE
jgi:hypothetical protein